MIKKAEEYLIYLFEEPYNLEEGSIEKDFLDVIKMAQLNAIEAAVKLCAENAETEEYLYMDCCPQCGHTATYINKDSILNCLEILKKEL